MAENSYVLTEKDLAEISTAYQASIIAEVRALILNFLVRSHQSKGGNKILRLRVVFHSCGAHRFEKRYREAALDELVAARQIALSFGVRAAKGPPPQLIQLLSDEPS